MNFEIMIFFLTKQTLHYSEEFKKKERFVSHFVYNIEPFEFFFK